MTTPVQQAKEALGERLREMRKDARLSGRTLATTLGWHFTKVSKIENGARSPSEDDIRAWCAACGADDQIPDLIATVRHVASMYHEYRRQMQAGMKHLQESSVPLYEATSLFRIYDTTVVPGLFTTAEYAAELFRFWQGFMGLKDDIDAAVEARIERQRVLYTGDRTFRVVIEEQVLRTCVGDIDVMAGQLDRLLAVMSLPRVTIGIIPATGERHSLTQGSFWMFDDTQVRIETVSASLTITQPRDIALYSRVFELLQRSAVYGREARQLITKAIRDLTDDAGLLVNLCQHHCPANPGIRSVELRSRSVADRRAGRPGRASQESTMRAPAEMTSDELREAHHTADALISEKFRSYLSGRMLPMLLGRFRDDMAEALGMELPPLPQRSGPVKSAKLDDLTSGELDELSGAVLILVTRFATLMDDPLLPKLLREFRDALVIEKADRARIADELRDKARAS